MDAPHILFEIDEHVANITLNRPETMNALAGDMRQLLLQGLESYATDPNVRCIVITGAGKAFCAGGDISAMARRQEENTTNAMGSSLEVVEKIVLLLRRMPQPVIAAINGPAAGGGMNMALACDIRLGCEKTLFSESFVKIGLIPDWGGFNSLTRLVGPSKAMELMMTGDRIKSEEAFRLGLLNQVFPSNSFKEQVKAFAQKLANGPPQTLAIIKQGIYKLANGSLEDALQFEAQNQSILFLSDDAREGMRAFIEKRPPKFSLLD